MVQIIFLLIVPFLLIQLKEKWNLPKGLSPVLLCYAFGILWSNFSIFSSNINKTASEATVLLAIPLLLFSTDLRGWVRFAKSTILSFALCVASGVFMAILMSVLFQHQIEDSWRVGGMLTGFFTGGAPNMNAVGIALQAEESLIVYLNATDIICGGILLLFLSSIAHSFLGLFLPKFVETNIDMPKKRKEKIPTEENNSFIEIESTLKAVFLAILIVGLSVSCTFLVTQEIKSAILIILGLTTLSVFASFFPTVRHWKGSFQAGEYLLLIFCLAIGLMADFSDLFHKSTPLLLMTAGVMYGTFLLHLFLAWWWKIDRDTVMITATAAIYGPAFIGQIISVIDNRKLLFSGMATGLVGYALGNFLGIGVANLLKSIL